MAASPHVLSVCLFVCPCAACSLRSPDISFLCNFCVCSFFHASFYPRVSHHLETISSYVVRDPFIYFSCIECFSALFCCLSVTCPLSFHYHMSIISRSSTHTSNHRRFINCNRKGLKKHPKHIAICRAPIRPDTEYQETTFAHVYLFKILYKKSCIWRLGRNPSFVFVSLSETRDLCATCPYTYPKHQCPLLHRCILIDHHTLNHVGGPDYHKGPRTFNKWSKTFISPKALCICVVIFIILC